MGRRKREKMIKGGSKEAEEQVSKGARARGAERDEEGRQSP